MRVNDIVVQRHDDLAMNGPRLYCGTGLYRCATVASMDPFILVSLEGDMRWSTKEPQHFESICEAHPRYVMRAQVRL